ncbi:54S ribosomal protein L17 mitochondrial [Bachmanniomyces sp. S44760]|nr:54S ribosomal protein L17 mitochondrial [Bachmanniomyces sp. S44760]
MSRGHVRARQALLQINPTPFDRNICSNCLFRIQRSIRHASSATATSSKATADLPPPGPKPKAPISSLSSTYAISASVILSRPPLLTRDLTPFEKAYYFYQRRLNERLALPFTRYFYYPKDTPEDLEWKAKIKERLTPARDIGRYSAYGKEGWNDELLVGGRESEPEVQVEALIQDAMGGNTGGKVGATDGEGTPDGEGGEGDVVVLDRKKEVERPLSRVTEADRTGNQKSLDRMLARTLYLLFRGTEGKWMFPTSTLVPKESLHTAAERTLVQAGGINMNTWVVGNVPIGHQSITYKSPVEMEFGNRKIEQLGAKTFFMKARIMAGQANLTENKLGLSDFRWLAKDEIRTEVQPQYWGAVKNMLVDRG